MCPLTYFCERQSASNKTFGSGGIRAHAPEETGALNQRLRPLGHATFLVIEKILEFKNDFLNNKIHVG